MNITLTPAARDALLRISLGSGDARAHTKQMISRLQRDRLIDFDLDSFKYVITDAGAAALEVTA